MAKLYRNKKNGGLYELLGEAIDVTNSRNGMEVVIYRPHGMVGVAPLYVREWMEFEQKFERVADSDLTPNAKVSGAGTASAGLTGYAGDNNGERK